jgi:hypothetical protein
MQLCYSKASVNVNTKSEYARADVSRLDTSSFDDLL